MKKTMNVLRKSLRSSTRVGKDIAFEPAKRCESVKPGVERSGTPGSLGFKGVAREAGRQLFAECTNQITSCRALRALRSSSGRQPGVPLRYTPGFMLSPRFAG
jgi:hypothetical protein